MLKLTKIKHTGSDKKNMDVLSKISLTLVKSLQLHSHRLPWCSVLSGNGPTLTYMCKRAIGKTSQSACCCIQAKKIPSHEQMATRTRMRRKTGNVLLTVWLFCRAMAAAVQKCPKSNWLTTACYFCCMLFILVG